jgi:positive regulator of sigma E activity
MKFERKAKISERIGEIVGFGAALTLFSSIIYYLLSRLGLIIVYISYPLFVFSIISIYIIYLIIGGVYRKWKQ